MYFAFITLKAYYLPAIFGAGFICGFIIQRSRVQHFRDKQIRAEQEKLKMQAEMLGMGSYYDSNEKPK